jgi:hypothetical protein
LLSFPALIDALLDAVRNNPIYSGTALFGFEQFGPVTLTNREATPPQRYRRYFSVVDLPLPLAD